MMQVLSRDKKREKGVPTGMSPGAVVTRTLAQALPPWWSLLISGTGWILVSLIVLRFDYASVFSISLLFGFVALAAGTYELGMTALTRGWWRVLSALLGLIYIAAGVVAFIRPGGTFQALAAVFSFFLVFAGASDIGRSISLRRLTEAWWVQLIGGIIEVALGFWAAGYWGRSAILLVAWVAAYAVVRGVKEVAFGFQLRELQHHGALQHRGA